MPDPALIACGEQAAQQNGVPWPIFYAQINQESGWNPNAKSSAGAIGIAQIMPSTAAQWGVNPNDPCASLNAAAAADAAYYQEFGSWPLALAAYNAGPGAVQQYGGIPPYAETQDYVQKIMAAAGTSGSANAAGSSGGWLHGAEQYFEDLTGLPEGSIAGIAGGIVNGAENWLQQLFGGAVSPFLRLPQALINIGWNFGGFSIGVALILIGGLMFVGWVFEEGFSIIEGAFDRLTESQNNLANVQANAAAAHAQIKGVFGSAGDEAAEVAAL